MFAESVMELLQDGVSERVDLGGVCAEPHEPHADDGGPDDDLAQTVRTERENDGEEIGGKGKRVCGSEKKREGGEKEEGKRTNPRSLLMGMKVKTTPRARKAIVT